MTIDNHVPLFGENKTVVAILLKEYLDWAAHPEKYAQLIALPPLQRGFVWKPSKIVNLWDSLLRGMPIGSLMLSRLEADATYVSLTNHTNRKTGKAPQGGYNLLDGQQRTLAMLLGWPNGPTDNSRCIWIDFGKPGINGSPFSIRITTQAQPFGFSPSDPDRKLALNERKTARDLFDKKDSKQEFKDTYDHELNLNLTRPKGCSNHTLQLRELWKIWQGAPEQWNENVMAKLENVEDSVVKRIERFGDALKRLEFAQIALILVPDLCLSETVANDRPDEDPLVVLFDRIATGGARLTPDEHLFALIKNAEPETHNIVHAMHKSVGHFLKANDIVMTAIRIAATKKELELNDLAEPKTRDFHRYLKNKNPLFEEFKRLITIPPENTMAPLHKALALLSDLLKYKGGSDIGLPRVAMPLLGRELLQILLFWVTSQQNNRRNDNESLLESRDEILRFILFWILCVNDPGKASHQAFLMLKKLQNADPGLTSFPGRILYEKLVGKASGEKSFALMLTTPGSLPKWPVSEHILRDWTERFGARIDSPCPEERAAYALYERWWDQRKRLLLWLQREYVEKKFSGYDPIAGRDEAKPYDYDHICPQDHWSDLSKVNCDPLTINSKKRFRNLSARRLLGNSIGNYRILNSSDNRSVQNDSPRKKLSLGDSGDALESKDVLKDSLTDSVIDEADIQLWRDASGEENAGRQWSEMRLIAFQEAVEKRTLSLYKRFFCDLKFDQWIN